MSTVTPLPDEVREQLAQTVEHFNADHADTVLLVARYAAGAETATDAEIVDVDVHGADIAVTADGRRWVARVDFVEPAQTSADVHMQVLAAIGRARAAAGDQVPATSMERELVTTRSLPTFVTSVASVRHLTSEVREIVLAGGLDGFVSRGADQFVFVMVPTDDAPIGDGYTMAEWRDADVRPPGAYYTVRSFDSVAGSITLWAVLHGHDDGVGGWAARCEPGDLVAVWGPREGMGFPTDARSVLLVADSSGAAAVASIVDGLTDSEPDVEIDVVIEIVDEHQRLPMHWGDNVRVEWRPRGEAAAGTSGQLLDAVRSHRLDPEGLVVFAAGESHEMTSIRKYLRTSVGLPATSVHAVAYWRRGGSAG